MPDNAKILVVDDEKGIRNLLKAMLEKKGYEVWCEDTGEKALEFLSRESCDLVITDLKLPGIQGEDILEKVKRNEWNVPVVVISAYGTTKKVVDLIKKGAENYLPKPFTLEDLEVVVMKALEKNRLLLENARLRREASGHGILLGKSKAVENVRKILEKFATSGANVLITGESGVGKELAAKAIHEMSSRAKGPLVLVNAGAIPNNLLEAELFGVKKGAFTGATESRLGLIQAAEGGTLFLDEIAEIPMESQVKLLRVLETGEVRSLGEVRSKKIHIRIIAATNRDLKEMVERKTFREDLYYRLSVLPLQIPPLRERTEDIPLLANYFLGLLNNQEKSTKKLSAEGVKWMMAQNWKGNVREFKNTIERAFLLSGEGAIEISDLSLSSPGEDLKMEGSFKSAKKVQIHYFEKKYLSSLLQECNGNVSEAARLSGLGRRNFQKLMKKHKLSPSRFREK